MRRPIAAPGRNSYSAPWHACLRGLQVIQRLVLPLAVFFISVVAFSQSHVVVPPVPRDGQGTAKTVVPILIYHSIRPYIPSDTPAVRRYIATPETLDKELAWLKENRFTSITCDDLVAHITRDAPLPLKPVIITFDDDWQSQYTYAPTLLKKYGFTATFYIWVAVVGMKNHMTWDEVKELDAAGMQIGCHTITHPILTKIAKDDVLKREILGANQKIEERIGKPVTSFAYPFGQYDARVVAVVREAGFTSARSTWPGVVHCTEGLLSLTGLIRTELTSSLVQTMTQYLNEASMAKQVIFDLPPPPTIAIP